MSYAPALSYAWEQLNKITRKQNHRVLFLRDEYEVNLNNRRILSLSCNISAKDYLSILILHYLIRKFKGLPEITGEWISFQQLSGGLGYYPTFKKRVVERILRKYGPNPNALLELVGCFNAKNVQLADVSIVLEAFERVPLLITLWRRDDEFEASANLHFDRSISDIFCTEDIVVMSECVVSII